MFIKKLFQGTLMCLFCCLSLVQQPVHAHSDLKETRKPLPLGEAVTFKSTVLNEERTINIRLPKSFNHQKAQAYPVIVLLDGAMDEDFVHIVGLVDFLSFSWIEHVPESIVVGITNVDRKRDFTFKSTDERDLKDFPTSGHSEVFIHFLEQELIPRLKQRFTVSSMTLIGQSLGGLLATQVLINKPQLFDRYLIVSPSLWWDKQSLLSRVLTIQDHQPKVFVAVGKEGAVMERDAKQLYDKIKKESNYPTVFRFYEELKHGDALHRAAYDGLSHLFSKKGSSAP